MKYKIVGFDFSGCLFDSSTNKLRSTQKLREVITRFRSKNIDVVIVAKEPINDVLNIFNTAYGSGFLTEKDIYTPEKVSPADPEKARLNRSFFKICLDLVVSQYNAFHTNKASNLEVLYIVPLSITYKVLLPDYRYYIGDFLKRDPDVVTEVSTYCDPDRFMDLLYKHVTDETLGSISNQVRNTLLGSSESKGKPSEDTDDNPDAEKSCRSDGISNTLS